jgi:hypothetical protein
MRQRHWTIDQDAITRDIKSVSGAGCLLVAAVPQVAGPAFRTSY